MNDTTEPAARAPEESSSPSNWSSGLGKRASSWWPRWIVVRADKELLEASLEAEISEHLGYDRHDPAEASTFVVYGEESARVSR